MKKLLLALLVTFSFLSFSHVVTVNVLEGKEKGEILIRAIDDSGNREANEEIYVLSDIAYDGDLEVFEEPGSEDFHGKLILFKGSLDDMGELTLPKPGVKRYIILIAGGGDHDFVGKGITLTLEDEENWEKVLEKHSKKLGDFFKIYKTKKF
ncbi:hypothetical protein STFE110948_02615 [Streptobacillus felis]|uniref:hypothetical protein n=1 Tax=Streptobacillus felis TaxID=1384509 RepID=UPI000830E72D|nr:hypothetical protein [Streptobacillus felis]